MDHRQPGELVAFLKDCGVSYHQFMGFEGGGSRPAASERPLVRIQFVRGKPADAIVDFFDPAMSKFEIHFRDGKAERICVANLGISGVGEFHATPQILVKLASVAKSNPTGFEGDFLSLLANALRIDDFSPKFSPHSQLPERNTHQHQGATMAVGSIQAYLNERAKRFYAPRVNASAPRSNKVPAPA